jgi:hypothetical protein
MTTKEIVPSYYQETSLRFRKLWEEYIDREERAKYAIINIVKILEIEGYSRTKAIEKIVNDGINGVQCDASLTTQQGETVNVDCISSGNNIIWYIYPTK